MRRRLDLHTRNRGFTLTELLVALVVLSLTSLLLLQGVMSGSRMWRHGEDVGATAETIQSAQELVRSRLERTYLETAYDAIPPYPFFKGDDAALTFDSVPPENSGDAEARTYTLFVTTSGDLAFSSVSVLDPTPYGKVSPLQRTEILLRGVQSVNISYFDPGPGAERGWKVSWIRRIHPPALVRVQVNFPPGDSRWWPPLLVHPIAMIDRSCQFLPHSSVCAGRS